MPDRLQLRRNTLLAVLDQRDLHALEPHLEIMALSRGTVLHEPDQPIDHVYFPLDSVVSLTVAMVDGAIAETATIGREGMVGVAAVLGDGRTQNRAIVQAEGAASRLRLRELEAALGRSTALSGLLLRYASALMGQVLQSVACNALHPAEARLARWLLLFQDRAGGARLVLTQEFV